MNGSELVPITKRSVAALAEVVGDERVAALGERATNMRRRIGGRTMWHVNSTAAGGGVAEMLHAVLGYVLDLDIDTRWLAIDGDPEFFELTKRLHNRLHGLASDGELGDADAALYARSSAGTAEALLDKIQPNDLVVLHDPQTAGLAGPLVDHGAVVVWRCHIGIDTATEVSEAAWAFLRPYISRAAASVFTRRAYVPGFLEHAHVIPPSIDPFSSKNRALDDATVTATIDRVYATARTMAERPPAPDEPVVLQVSRWDRLKDMVGVMAAFATHVAPGGPGYLILAGPDVRGVSDDPEGAEVLAECLDAWKLLPDEVRDRVMLAELPMADRRENAVMVNALQRHAAVVVQKSLAEGFGLTVAEAMWKGRPVVGSHVGGIADQIAEGSGRLVPPRDHEAFGAAVRQYLDDPAAADAAGRAARERVWTDYLPDTQLLRWADLLDAVLDGTVAAD